MFRLILALLLISSCAAAQALDSTLTYPLILPGKKLVLPDKLREVIAEKFPDWRLPTQADFRSHHPQDSADAVAMGKPGPVYYVEAWYFPPEHELPWICWGDFNGDGLTDVAMILMRKDAQLFDDNHEGPRAIFAIFHRTATGYDFFTPWKKDYAAWGYEVIRTVPPGMIPPLPTGEAREELTPTQFDSIEWLALGKASSRWYWKDGSYHQLFTGD